MEGGQGGEGGVEGCLGVGASGGSAPFLGPGVGHPGVFSWLR